MPRILALLFATALAVQSADTAPRTQFAAEWKAAGDRAAELRAQADALSRDLLLSWLRRVDLADPPPVTLPADPRESDRRRQEAHRALAERLARLRATRDQAAKGALDERVAERALGQLAELLGVDPSADAQALSAAYWATRRAPAP